MFNFPKKYYNLSSKEREKKVKSLKSSPTLCDPMDCSLPGPSIHGVFQARVLEWAAISFSKVSSRHTDGTQVSHIAGRRYHLSHQGSYSNSDSNQITN